ncbi:MAG: hypothetical protein FKY71_15980 [Spiribacter salinus]|uniref:Uncharacterized protein n=1 Tax=Spiribacter salinus TaxID=1335746 RepID=A0A540VLE1_9GAMM|nr:MAG: hypothetical protein FKY71_15980 [Spiribacter salinus]
MTEILTRYKLANGKVVSADFRKRLELRPDPIPYRMACSSSLEGSRKNVARISPDESKTSGSSPSNLESIE